MADETPAAELTLEQELTQFYKGKEGTTPGEPAKETPKQPAVADKDKEGVVVADEDPLEKLLKEIPDEETPKEKEETPQALSTEHKSILAAIPNAEVASNLIQIAENHSNFSNAFEAGKFDDVVQMFERWDKPKFEDFLDYIYQKHVAKDGEWVTRFIAEQEGRGGEHKGMSKLERKVAELETKLTEKEKKALESNAATESQRVFEDYKAYVGTLFDKLQTPAKDRPYILRDLNDRVAGDPKVMEAVKSGNKSAVHSLFKTAVREFNTRDKQTADTQDKKLEEQGKKKTLVPGGTGLPVGEVPDDVKDVPKAERETWMRNKLTSFFKSKGLGAK